jgi:hypothetical protein
MVECFEGTALMQPHVQVSGSGNEGLREGMRAEGKKEGREERRGTQQAECDFPEVFSTQGMDFFEEDCMLEGTALMRRMHK